MSLQTLIDSALANTPPNRPIWIALSGGLDSSLLLTLAAQAARSHPRPLYALHVNHALQPAADDFEHHCTVLCSRLGVPLFVERVHVEPVGEGIEAAARKARYAAFARRAKAGETLWLAQHADDQAETLLLAALRGSGVRGLAGMPLSREWRGVNLVRPLLGASRAELEREAKVMELSWVEDPTNRDCAFDRNFLRRQVVPLLDSRWPGAARALARSARFAGEADELLGELAELDLTTAGSDPGRLSCQTIKDLTPARQRLLIRYACHRLGLPTPPGARLEEMLLQLNAREDAQAHIDWPGGEARYWRGELYLQAPQRMLPAMWGAQWDGRPGLETPCGPVDCHLQRKDDEPAEHPAPALYLTLRRGGEYLQVAGRGRRDVKRLLQEAGIPPWQRSCQLLAWHDETLVAVLGVAVAKGWVMVARH